MRIVEPDPRSAIKDVISELIQRAIAVAGEIDFDRSDIHGPDTRDFHIVTRVGDLEFDDEAPIPQHQDDVRYDRSVPSFENRLVECEIGCPDDNLGIVRVRNMELGKRHLQSRVEDFLRELVERGFACGGARDAVAIGAVRKVMCLQLAFLRNHSSAATWALAMAGEA